MIIINKPYLKEYRYKTARTAMFARPILRPGMLNDSGMKFSMMLKTTANTVNKAI